MVRRRGWCGSWPLTLDRCPDGLGRGEVSVRAVPALDVVPWSVSAMPVRVVQVVVQHTPLCQEQKAPRYNTVGTGALDTLTGSCRST